MKGGFVWFTRIHEAKLYCIFGNEWNYDLKKGYFPSLMVACALTRLDSCFSLGVFATKGIFPLVAPFRIACRYFYRIMIEKA